jgi:nucleoid-associated protein YgaU
MLAGVKNRMLMTRYSVKSDGTIKLDPLVSFTTMINPADVKHVTGITYDKQKTLGEANGAPKFSAVADEKLSFSLVLDSTGVVPGLSPVPVPVKLQIKLLSKVVYDYVGTLHETPYTRLLWGTLIFYGRLESMSTSYTLFKPSGEPLRAKVDLSFIGATTRKASGLMANRSSPDLTHRVTVREGDTLPLLCERIYGDPGWYLDVAAFNGLNDFRRLAPGRQLSFPPLA